jgi:hypothetical protein
VNTGQGRDEDGHGTTSHSGSGLYTRCGDLPVSLPTPVARVAVSSKETRLLWIRILVLVLMAPKNSRFLAQPTRRPAARLMANDGAMVESPAVHSTQVSGQRPQMGIKSGFKWRSVASVDDTTMRQPRLQGRQVLRSGSGPWHQCHQSHQCHQCHLNGSSMWSVGGCGP